MSYTYIIYERIDNISETKTRLLVKKTVDLVAIRETIRNIETNELLDSNLLLLTEDETRDMIKALKECI